MMQINLTGLPFAKVDRLMTSFFALTEEILSQSSATWFSPQGGHLLYATFNATNVGEVSFKIYEGEGYNQGEPSVYGTEKSLRYPKVCKC